jgi:streptogramin lyase
MTSSPESSSTGMSTTFRCRATRSTRARFYSGTIASIDPATRAVVAKVALPERVGGVLFAAGSVWATGYDSNVLYRLDPQTLKTILRIRVGRTPRQSVFAAGSIWTVNQTSSTITRFAP